MNSHKNEIQNELQEINKMLSHISPTTDLSDILMMVRAMKLSLSTRQQNFCCKCGKKLVDKSCYKFGNDQKRYCSSVCLFVATVAKLSKIKFATFIASARYICKARRYKV